MDKLLGKPFFKSLEVHLGVRIEVGLEGRSVLTWRFILDTYVRRVIVVCCGVLAKACCFPPHPRVRTEVANNRDKKPFIGSSCSTLRHLAKRAPSFEGSALQNSPRPHMKHVNTTTQQKKR